MCSQLGPPGWHRRIVVPTGRGSKKEEKTVSLMRCAASLLFEHVKSRRFVRRAQSMTSRISNRFLRVHLLSILRKVVLRPNARTFAHNLHLTLVAKMISGAYDFNWATVFIAAWVHYALLGLFLLYLSLLGCFCTVLDCIHHSRRGKAYLKTLLAAFGGIWVFSVSVLSIVSNFLFFLALATRLDGDKSVSTWQLFGPLMAHYIFSAVLGPVRYLVDKLLRSKFDVHAQSGRYRGVAPELTKRINTAYTRLTDKTST